MQTFKWLSTRSRISSQNISYSRWSSGQRMASQSKAPAIGIDLGTTNSCVAVWLNNRVEIIADDLGFKTTPSCVAFTDEDRLIGRPAKLRVLKKPSGVVFDAKRLIGRRFSDETVQNDIKNWRFQVIADSDDKPVIVVQFKGEEKQFYPEQVSAMVLERMREVAESFLGTSVKDAVVTVPAYFNDAQRQATKVAGTIAGLNIMQIINEPTAAALAYGFQRNAGKEGSKNVLVFDFGGGTFDVSLVSIKGSDYKVNATGGDTHLGGEDMNNRMMNYLIQVFKQKHDQDISNNCRALSRLRMQCEEAKCQLSATVHAEILIDCLYKDIDFAHTVTRAWFENDNSDLFNKCMEVVDKCMQDANIEKESVDDIVLVGGSTRIPMVQRLLKEKFGNKQLCKNINPDEAVAYGAAIQAALLNGVESKELRKLSINDVTSISLGIEIDGGLMSILVPRNTRLPVKNVRKEFVTIEDNQTSVNIRVFQGEREMASENSMLAEFRLKDFAPAPRGKTKIYVDFNIDVNGHLQVSAVEESSGKKNCITVIVDKGRMSPEQIQKMTEDNERYKLRMYAKKMGDAILKDDISTKVSYLEGKNITNAVEEALKWLQENNDAQVQEITTKLKQLKIICKAIDG